MSEMISMNLEANWRVFLVRDEDLHGEIRRLADAGDAQCVKAQVPGDWVLDYARAGLLEEPFYQDNYLKIRDYETTHVFYQTTFDWQGGDKGEASILFEGIDTVADVYLNGEMIGHAENMYIPHEFPARGLLTGENELLIHITPAEVEARKHPIGAFNTALKYNYAALVVRKAAHMFGWDICPRIVSSGLWRPVRVVVRKPERVEDVFLWVDHLTESGDARVVAAFDVEIGNRPTKGYTLALEGVCGESAFHEEQALWYVHGRMEFTIRQPKLWWPRFYGEPNRYHITCTLLKDGRAVDSVEFDQGLRTAELLHDDYIGQHEKPEFCFVINKKRVYVQGTNWVPADAFHGSDMKRIPQILDMVKDVGCNALRVWGGGVYESDYFYDWCDANGVMVWQDFMMACGIYPHTRRMKDQLTQEAQVIVKRLRRHASICLWAGDNECDQNYSWTSSPVDPTRNVLTREILPAVLHEEDRSRPYLPCSPYVSHLAYEAGKVFDTPEQHLWGPRDYFKSHFYHDATAVFASEMGYHGCNSPMSIEKFIGKDAAWPVDGNPMYLYHAASPELQDSPYTYRIPLMSSQLRYLFEQEPANLDEYARMSQISQAEAKKYFVESFRSRKGERTGLIWWNIMDNWPQISDAVVDYYFCRKLAYFYIRRSQAEVCLMADDHTGENALYGASNLDHDVRVSYTVKDMDTGAAVAAGESVLAADASTPLCALRDDGGRHFYLIEWTLADGTTGKNHYLQGKPKYDFHWYMDCLKRAGFDEFEGF